MTIQSQNPYFGPQQFLPQQQPMGFGGTPAHLGAQHASPYGAQFAGLTGQLGAQQYPTLPGYQPVVFQVPQQLVPELVAQGYGQPVTPILPIAYAPIIAGGQAAMATPWAGQQTPWASGQAQFGQQMLGQQPFGQQQFTPSQYLPQQFGQRPTLW